MGPCVMRAWLSLYVPKGGRASTRLRLRASTRVHARLRTCVYARLRSCTRVYAGAFTRVDARLRTCTRLMFAYMYLLMNTRSIHLFTT